MHRKKLEDLNLIDDFLFNKMVSHPEFGEEFSRELLKVIFGKVFGKLKVVPQKVYYGSDIDKHGARLDVYLEEEIDEEGIRENVTIFDIEPESENKDEDMETLARRIRFYHSKIDAGSMKAGIDYRSLKDVIVIMIMTEDLLKANRMVYTIENKCKELPELSYDDGAKTIFLYTKGTEGNPRKELQEFLEYMENSCEANVKNGTLKKIHEMVNTVKQDEEVSLEYMKIYEKEQWLIEKGRKEEQKRTKVMEAKLAEKDAEIAEKDAKIAQLMAQLENRE